MTLLAVWCAEDRLWMASDSRLSDEGGPLIDEGVKIFELPVVCRAPSEQSGFFEDVYFATSFGLGCAGHSLVYHQIHANLLPLLGNLIDIQGRAPSIADIAAFTADVGTRYVRSLGHRRPQDADQVRLLLAGWCPITGTLAAYEMRPRVVDALMRFTVSQLDLSTPHFVGDHCHRARELHDEIAAADLPGASRNRAPLNVIRQLIEDTNMQSIGGDVQVGFTVGPTFQRVRTSRPIPGREPKAAFWLNAICTDDLPPVGPCALGLMGSVSP
jgi:hypothetical protein